MKPYFLYFLSLFIFLSSAANAKEKVYKTIQYPTTDGGTIEGDLF